MATLDFGATHWTACMRAGTSNDEDSQVCMGFPVLPTLASLPGHQSAEQITPAPLACDGACHLGWQFYMSSPPPPIHTTPFPAACPHTHSIDLPITRSRQHAVGKRPWSLAHAPLRVLPFPLGNKNASKRRMFFWEDVKQPPHLTSSEGGSGRFG